MKKHLIYLTTAVSAFLICTSAYAKIDSVLPDEASVTVKGSYNESGIAVTAAIKPIIGSGDENGGIKYGEPVYVKQIMTDENGKYQFITDELKPQTSYLLTINSLFNKTETEEFYISTEEERMNVLERISKLSADTDDGVAEVISILESSTRDLGISLDNFNKLEDKAQVAKKLIDDSRDAVLKGTGSAEVIKRFNQNTEELLIAEEKMRLKKTEALKAVQEAAWGELLSVIEKYPDVFTKLPGEVFNKITDKTYQNNVLKSIDKSEFKTVSEFEKLFLEESNRQYGEYVKNQSGKDTGSGKGSQSGGSSSGGYAVSGIINGNADTNKPTPSDTTVTSRVFSDMNDYSWAVTAVDYLYNKKIINGVSNDEFSPEAAVTREQFVKMVILALSEVNEAALADFSDVTRESWAYPYVATAYEFGIINGVLQDKFGFGEKITREDMAVILCRALKVFGYTLEEKRENKEFYDIYDASDYAKTYIARLYTSSIINGVDGDKFLPKGTATRAQAAQIIYNAVTAIGGSNV